MTCIYMYVKSCAKPMEKSIPKPGIWPDRILQQFASLKWPNEHPNAIQTQAPKEPSDSIKNHWMLRGTPWETYVFPQQIWRMSSKFPFQVWQRIRSSAVQIQLGQYTAQPSAKVLKSHLPSAVGHLDVSGRFDWAEAAVKSSAMGVL